MQEVRRGHGGCQVPPSCLPSAMGGPRRNTGQAPVFAPALCTGAHGLPHWPRPLTGHPSDLRPTLPRGAGVLRGVKLPQVKERSLTPPSVSIQGPKGRQGGQRGGGDKNCVSCHCGLRSCPVFSSLPPQETVTLPRPQRRQWQEAPLPTSRGVRKEVTDSEPGPGTLPAEPLPQGHARSSAHLLRMANVLSFGEEALRTDALQPGTPCQRQTL